MNKSEKWQIAISAIQTIVITLTMIGAFYIGIKQNEINEKLLNLNYFPSIEVAYTPENKRIQIRNKGNSIISLWGTKDLQSKSNIENNPVIITQKGSYYIFGNKLEEEIIKRVGTDGDIYIPFELYISGSNNIKYIVRNRLYCQVKNGKVSIHSQTIAIDQQDWPSR